MHIADIPVVHAAIAPPKTLRSQRRALYRFAVELLAPGVPPLTDHDVIDSPVARAHVGAALTGRTSLDTAELVAISTMSRGEHAVAGIAVASRREANTLLTGALETVWAELDRQQAVTGPARVLTVEDGQRFDSAHAVLRGGVALARQMSPDLVGDLLGHIALIGIIDQERTEQLASASPRDVPGLVLLETPSRVAVAEALVHEGAHQKLFDLAITHDLLNASSDRCPPFHPPWRPGARWPLEQALAAAHTYCCLAAFEQHVAASGQTPEIAADSLLPRARERSKILGEWLLSKGDHLGADAHRLLAGLLGESPRGAAQTEDPSTAPFDEYVIDTGLKIRRCDNSDRVLVGRSTDPPELYWVSEDAAQFLELARCNSADQVVGLLTRRWQLPRADTAVRLAGLLSDLEATGLVTLQGHPEPGR